jgi:hypothetical protein
LTLASTHEYSLSMDKQSEEKDMEAKRNTGSFPLELVISGGQTGADRAGLEVGRRLGYRTGGTVPKGFRTATGPDPTLRAFGVTEDDSPDYPPRTIRNVRDSDGTVWFGARKTPGGRLTTGTALRNGKPLIVNPSPGELRQWIIENRVKVLNVAGDREESDPGIQVRVEEILMQAFAEKGSEKLTI